jgi:hypothetical protein
MPIIKRKKGKRERWLAISAISDLKFKKKIFHCGIWRFYYTKKAILTGLTNTYNAL